MTEENKNNKNNKNKNNNLSNDLDNIDNSEDETVIVNPYNFNNNLLKLSDINNLLSEYDIDLTLKNLSLYQLAFIHSSYTKKAPSEIGENVVLASKPEGALELINPLII